MADSDLIDGALVLGKLRVVRKLGAGGIGAVYEVEHELTKHRRALKVLHAKYQGDRNLIERFLREASAAGRIGNPHIVETFDAGQLDDGTPWLLMELLDGEPFTETLRRNGRLEPGAAAAFLIEVCGAVAAAHAALIVHRDLKPDNLFVTVRGGRPFVKVLDFGISKFEAESGAVSPTGTTPLGVTGTGIALGTPLYMAPEQMRGAKDADLRADVYALGVVAYESLAGGTPYFAPSWAELAQRVLQGGAAPVEQLRPEVPRGLADAVMRAMALKREDRFQSLADFAAALAPYAALPGTGHPWWQRGTEREIDATAVRTEPASAPPPTEQDTYVRPLATPVARHTSPDVPSRKPLGVLPAVLLGVGSIVGVSWAIAAVVTNKPKEPAFEIVSVQAIDQPPPPVPEVVVPPEVFVDAGTRRSKRVRPDAGLHIDPELAPEM